MVELARVDLVEQSHDDQDVEHLRVMNTRRGAAGGIVGLDHAEELRA